jgi:glutamate dehydrogenase (NAD(P)+)
VDDGHLFHESGQHGIRRGYRQADFTGRGVFVVGCEAIARLGMEIKGLRVAVQGFGNVGGVAARLFAEAGAKIVAVQDHVTTVVDPAGIDIAALHAHVAHDGSVAGFKGAAELKERSHFWELDCDVLVPAALEQQITELNAPKIRAKLILEGANGPTTPEADDILHDKGVLIVPDVIANAGGVTVSYFEWVQDFSSFFWTEDEINLRLTRIMREAFAAVWQLAEDKKVSLRTAAFIVGCTRVLQAREMRGLYP